MLYFFLGNTPDLSLLELQTLYSGDFEHKTKEIVSFAGEIEFSSLERLGGTRKVAESLATVPLTQLTSKLTELIGTDPAKNIAITDYADLGMERSVFHTIKSSVDRSIRFVSLETTEHELLMLSHQHVAEFNLIPSGDDGVAIAKTVWIYDAKDWVSRDRNKPYRDIKRGMLPPKVARIMVNLAACGREDITLADPFCGTGTILTEAVMVGCNVVGSDTNPDAIPGSKSNLEWLLSTPDLPRKDYKLIVGDCTHFSEFAPAVDCIATEPYMGPLLDERNPLSLEKIKNIAKGLGKLYLGAFKAFHKVLPVGGRVVMSIPVFAVYGRLLETISIDSLASLGYNYVQSVAYSKPGAAVIRNITILEKK
jgi:tRNA G10  N-methylase Trm11